MTTEPTQPSAEGEWIPRYFSDFRREFDAFKDENARQHVDLIKWMVATMLGVTAVWGGVVYTVVATLS